MPDYEGRKGSIADLYPKDQNWAREVWRDRKIWKHVDGGADMIREATRQLV